MATTNLQKMVMSLQGPMYRRMLKHALSDELSPCYCSKEYLAGTFKENGSTIICRLRDSNCCNCNEYKEQDQQERYCSHMFRLAVEFELIDKEGRLIKIPSHINSNGENIDQAFDEIVQGFETAIPEEMQHKFTEYTFLHKIVSYINGRATIPFALQKAESNPLIKIGMFEECHKSNIGLLLDGYPFDIVKHLDEQGFIWPGHLPKTKKGTYSVKGKRNWCIENIEDAINAAGDSISVVMVRPTQKFCSVFALFLEYIQRKYCDKTSTEKFGRYTLRHPYGAIVTNFRDSTYEFPNDIVTSQLNKHKCNRCTSKELGDMDLLIPSLDSKHSDNFTFSIKIPQRSDYEEMTPYIIPLLEFYQTSFPSSSVYSFFSINQHLAEMDKYINDLYEKSGFVAVSAFRTFLSECIKNEKEIKTDFETVEVHLNDGRVIIGYEAMANNKILLEQIHHVVFCA